MRLIALNHAAHITLGQHVLNGNPLGKLRYPYVNLSEAHCVVRSVCSEKDRCRQVALVLDEHLTRSPFEQLPRALPWLILCT